MPIATATVITAAKVLIPVVKGIYDQVQAYQERAPELKKVGAQLDFILSSFKYLEDKGSTLPAQLKGIDDDKIMGTWKDDFDKIQKKIETITNRWKISQLLLASKDLKALAKVCITLDRIGNYINILINSNTLEITKYTSMNTEGVKAMQQVADQKLDKITETVKESSDKHSQEHAEIVAGHAVLYAKIITALREQQPTSTRRQITQDLTIETATDAEIVTRKVEEEPGDTRIEKLEKYINLLKFIYKDKDPLELFKAADDQVDKEYKQAAQLEKDREASAPNVSMQGNIKKVDKSLIAAEYNIKRGKGQLTKSPATASTTTSTTSSSSSSSLSSSSNSSQPSISSNSAGTFSRSSRSTSSQTSQTSSGGTRPSAGKR